MGVITLRVETAGEMRALGERIARRLRAGDVVLLEGDMGAGKSEWARGAARGLGITGAVPSPTFTIMNAYDEGRLPLYHFDLYRLQDEAELDEIGFEAFAGGDGVALIEWPQIAYTRLPDSTLSILIEPEENEARRVTISSHGHFDIQRLVDIL